jgi:hypothetical protein
MKKMRCTTFEGPAARLAALVVACASLAAAAALAPRAALAQAACTEIENDTERLACYDRALRPTRPATAAPAAAAPAAPAQRAAPAAPPSTQLSTERSVEPRRARSAQAEAAAAAPSAPSAPGGVRDSRDDDVVPIVVVRVREIMGRNDRAFTTDNGVVWLQTDNAKLKVPETPFNAEIKPGAMGSFFLVTENRNRAIRVRRQN